MHQELYGSLSSQYLIKPVFSQGNRLYTQVQWGDRVHKSSMLSVPESVCSKGNFGLCREYNVTEMSMPGPCLGRQVRVCRAKVPRIIPGKCGLQCKFIISTFFFFLYFQPLLIPHILVSEEIIFVLCMFGTQQMLNKHA